MSTNQSVRFSGNALGLPDNNLNNTLKLAIGSQSIKPMNQRNTNKNVSQAGTGLIAHYIMKNVANNGDVSISLNNFKGKGKGGPTKRQSHLESISEFDD